MNLDDNGKKVYYNHLRFNDEPFYSSRDTFYVRDENLKVTLETYTARGATQCLVELDTGTWAYSIAFCNKRDSFNKKKGRLISHARAMSSRNYRGLIVLGEEERKLDRRELIKHLWTTINEKLFVARIEDLNNVVRGEYNSSNDDKVDRSKVVAGILPFVKTWKVFLPDRAARKNASNKRERTVVYHRDVFSVTE